MKKIFYFFLILSFIFFTVGCRHKHTYSEKVFLPTCVDKGYTEYTCECGDVYQGNEVNALGHSYGSWVVVKEATEQEEGKIEKTCNVCGD